MSAFLLSPEADEDVWNIWRYLVEEASVSVANRIEAELFHAFEMLARTPGIGLQRRRISAICLRCDFDADGRDLHVYSGSIRVSSIVVFPAN